jgi:cytochrome o ubiquinol oxidase subunit II
LRLRSLLLLPLLLGLGACSTVVLDPAGDIAARQRDLLVVSTYLMLLIIVPVMALVVFFAWKYRASNRAARYEPDWDHSTHLELVIWAAPLLIIICLGAMTWAGTHLLDPYRPLDRVKQGQTVAASAKPLEVNVVALDWKWLFIYPEYGVASVNELAAPVDRPIRFNITSSSVMNSFYIPALAGQIYAMPGMETKLHAVINHPGEYEGFSANYSGDGFSNMRFAFHGLDEKDFEAWIAKVRQANADLDRASYLELERPSEKVPVGYYSKLDPVLWEAIVNMCVEPGKMCMGEMMAIDRRGGLGLEAAHNTAPLLYDKNGRRGSAVLGAKDAYVLSICTPTNDGRGGAPRVQRAEAEPTPGSGAPMVGAGLPRLSALTALTAPPSRPSSNS